MAILLNLVLQYRAFTRLSVGTGVDMTSAHFDMK